jgi:hypothetical protein
VKPTIEVRRASHVNAGTAVPKNELAWPEIGGRVSRLPRTHVEVDERAEVTPYGGLAIATAFLRRFKVADRIDRHVQVLLVHLPYHESDHVLAQVLNLYVGGTCIEDVANLQHRLLLAQEPPTVNSRADAAGTPRWRPGHHDLLLDEVAHALRRALRSRG